MHYILHTREHQTTKPSLIIGDPSNVSGCLKGRVFEHSSPAGRRHIDTLGVTMDPIWRHGYSPSSLHVCGPLHLHPFLHRSMTSREWMSWGGVWQWDNPITLYVYPIPSRTYPSSSWISGFVAVGFYYNIQHDSPITAGIGRDPSRTSPFSMLQLWLRTSPNSDNLHCCIAYGVFCRSPYNGTPFTAPHVSISPCPCCMMYRRCFYFHLGDCRSYYSRPPLDATAPRRCSSSSMIVEIIIRY